MAMSKNFLGCMAGNSTQQIDLHCINNKILRKSSIKVLETEN